jgi:2-(1,2-epoxy-1,2-dihydrophenyl)acetyl-CoA isomerase
MVAPVLESYRDGVCTIIFNRPERRNAFDYDMLEGLRDGLQRAVQNKAQFVILRGSGKSFSSGSDIIDYKNAEDTEALVVQHASLIHESIKLIRTIPAIVIAVLEGFVSGSAVGLSLACDLSIAAKNTIINFGYRRIGLTPYGGASIFLSRIVGAKRFNEFYLLSRNIFMEEAKELGLVNLVSSERELENDINKTIAGLQSLPMETVEYFKNLTNTAVYGGLDVQLDQEKAYVSKLAGDPIFRERIETFLKKTRRY